MHPRASQLITALHLEPHPEGGFYREIFRSSARVTTDDDRGSRAALTTIFFLLTEDQVSRWHQVRSDEVWHLYEGGPLELLDLDVGLSQLDRHRLAAVDREETRPVCVIAAGHWQAARTLGPYALVGCTVAPGFDFADFRLMADDQIATSALRRQWPALTEWI